MELYRTHGSPWALFVPSPPLFHAQHLPDNYVQWTQTPDSHLFSADLPGMRKEEIRVELEDSRYLVIRSELRAADSGGCDGERRKKEFLRKFRLPAMVDVEGISAAYQDGLLTVRVPRAMAAVAGPRGQLRIELVGDETSDVLRGGGAARAA